MDDKKFITDGNEAAAYIAYNLSEVIAIYPITPSSNMGEWADQWASEGKKNVWDITPSVIEMQSEGGAAGTVHGALQAGALSSTFTASQGLLLMIPNMYKIAGELTPTVFHIAARTIATSSLSIFGDHSDVMACRQTGFAMLASASVQEAMDMALIAHSATLKAKVPFLHFFEGFRISHELQNIQKLSKEDILKMIDEEDIIAIRNNALTPDSPLLRGTAQNPDVTFQSREAVTPYYDRIPQVVQETMDRFAKITGRQYHLFDYYGAPDAERVIVIIGSGGEIAHEAIERLHGKEGEKVGVLKVRLYRPFSIKDFINAMPKTVKKIAVLDRCKEPGSLGEPLYQDVLTAYAESGETMPKMVAGRYGLSSKEFTPAMVKGIFDELKKDNPKHRFTIGINDDVSNTSLSYDPSYQTENEEGFRGIFIGLGADGTVSANKNSIKIIGDETDYNTQGYFVYDSKKSGSITMSHLRFGKEKIRSSYLITHANFIACHQFSFTEKLPILDAAAPGATFLLNAPYPKEEVWNNLPREMQQEMIDKNIKFYAIDAYKVAEDTNMGVRINTIMQTCFFAIANILPKDEAIAKIKKTIEKTFGKKGEEVVKQNFAAVDHTLAHLYEIDYPKQVTSNFGRPKMVSDQAPEFVKDVLATIMLGKGDDLPVSKIPADGTFPTATTKWEKRNIALSIPVWEPDICIQCGKCSMMCPHAVIRSKVYDSKFLADAPQTFKHCKPKSKDIPENYEFTIQVAPEDCTGCGLCVETCPAKSKTDPNQKAINMAHQIPLREPERPNWDFFLNLPDLDRAVVKTSVVKDSQLLRPLFEFSGACAGCGETPYIRLVTQLFGDRMLVANATGCSSIYGANLPTTPYAVDINGRGPAWSNSLFEDNAEFGLGFRLAVNKKAEQAVELVKKLSGTLGDTIVKELTESPQENEADIKAQRDRVAKLKEMLTGKTDSDSQHLLSLADYLVKKSVWIFGGDGWGYDIGYGGLDHVLASGQDVNILLLDTEVYSNTGGQMSKATPIGAVAKFAAGGKVAPKKDLGLLAIAYGNVYVGRVALGANDSQALKAIIEAEEFKGPSIIIAYSHCIAHGFNLKDGGKHQKTAVDSGYWPLYRYNPDLADKGENPFKLDSKPPKIPVTDHMNTENRFRMLQKADPERAAHLAQMAQEQVYKTWNYYQGLAASHVGSKEKPAES